MIYQVDEIKKEVCISDMNESHMYIGMMSLEELKDSYQLFHIHQYDIDKYEQTSFENQNVVVLCKDYYFGFVELINARNVFLKKDTLSFFIFRNLFLVVVIDDEDQHIQRIFESSSDYVMQRGISITRLVYYFFNELISKDYQYIEQLQEEIEELENEDPQNLANNIRQFNKELLLLGHYYNNLVGIGEELEMNHYHIFEEDDMRYFEVFTKRLERLSSNIMMLREMLNQATLEHQSKLDYKLNKSMQLLSVVTTIFMPLTLITGWYGMNFKNMPELNYRYSYYIVIVLSLSIVFGLILFFKKKKFF